MFLFENARGECVSGVSRQHGHGTLNDDWAPVEFGRDEVDGDTAHFHPVSDRLLLRIESRECRQQRRMNVEDAVRERFDQRLADKTHESGKTHQTNITRLQLSGKGTIVVLSRRERAMREDDGFNARGTRALEASGIGTVRDHDRDRRIQTSVCDGVNERLEVRSSSRNQDTQTIVGWFRHSHCCEDSMNRAA